jgi:peptide/nickel transport system substrate-binding protein
MTAIDMGKAGELFKQAGKIVTEDCPILYLGDEKAVMLLNKSFKGYTPNPAYKDIVFFYDCYREKEAIE